MPALSCLLPVGGAVRAREPSPREYVVVASPDVPVDGLSLGELRSIFEFERRFWSTRRPVIIVLTESNLAPGSPLLERIYRRGYPELRRLILEKLYQGQLDLAPKVVGSDVLAVDLVAAGRGVLALVEAEAVRRQAVKVLAIDGTAPGSDGYPLRR